jgi:hypothetical protein
MQLVAIWTGSEMILLADGPTSSISQFGGPFEGAAYDPSTDSWTAVTPPIPPTGHSFMWVSAVQAGAALLAWSDWATTLPISCGPGLALNCISTDSGTDLFRYDEQTAQWHILAAANIGRYAASGVLWTGRLAILRGPVWCGGCLGPDRPDETSQYDPARNSWTILPPDPLAWAHPVSAWTGEALFSFNAMRQGSFPPLNGGSLATLNTGDASAYDPASGWVRLPSAPFGCDHNPSPVWTGRQILMYCPGTATGAAASNGGLAFTVGSSPR